MRLFPTVVVILALACMATAAGAQDFCPFLAFCDAQGDRCLHNCSALADVVAWPRREAWTQQCSSNCALQHRRCVAHLSRRCFAPPDRR